MKLQHLILSAALLALPSCEQKQTPTDKVKDKVNDALDRRPGEKVRDVTEDAKDAVKDVKDAVKDSVK